MGTLTNGRTTIRYDNWPICHVCTPLGRTPAETYTVVRRQNAVLDSPYWRVRAPAT
ncbi:hypothetical protein AB0933_09020 [Streptomyces venezuelae]|uniref:hypothetical protein n=1 Tax=Streptomyces venezuelae TaxID=54571 RepID=UPI00345362D9